MSNMRGGRTKDKGVNVIDAVRSYIDKIVSDPLATGA